MASNNLFNHAFALCFSVESDKDGENVLAPEIRSGLLKRIADLNDSELLEAVGIPFDTYEVTFEDALRQHEFNLSIITRKFT